MNAEKRASNVSTLDDIRDLLGDDLPANLDVQKVIDIFGGYFRRNQNLPERLHAVKAILKGQSVTEAARELASSRAAVDFDERIKREGLKLQSPLTGDVRTCAIKIRHMGMRLKRQGYNFLTKNDTFDNSSLLLKTDTNGVD